MPYSPPKPGREPGLLDPRPRDRAIPLGIRGALSDPRTAVTTVDPLGLQDPRVKSYRLQKRLVSRGDSKPILGAPIRLPDGTIGGEPVSVQGLMAGAEKVPVVNSGTDTVQAQYAALARMVNWRRATNKKSIAVITPGIAAVTVARNPRRKPGTPRGWKGGFPIDLQRGFRHVPAPVAEKTASLSATGRLTYASRLRLLNDPPNVITLSEAVKQTPRWLQLFRTPQGAVQAAGEIPRGQTVDFNTGGQFPIRGRITGTSETAMMFDARAGGGGSGGGGGTPFTWPDFGSGKGTLSDAVRMTPSIYAELQRRKGEISSSLSNAVLFTQGKGRDYSGPQGNLGSGGGFTDTQLYGSESGADSLNASALDRQLTQSLYPGGGYGGGGYTTPATMPVSGVDKTTLMLTLAMIGIAVFALFKK